MKYDMHQNSVVLGDVRTVRVRLEKIKEPVMSTA